MSLSIFVPPKLRAGDRVRLVSPASTPTISRVEREAEALARLGLKVEFGQHIFDEYGYLAGSDVNRLADFNAALRDPGIKAIIATCGGKGAYRIAGDIDFAALRAQPKLLVGFSEITILHLAAWKNARVTSLHGAPWNAEESGQQAADSFWRAAMTTQPLVFQADKAELTSSLTTTGQATGRLLGGNLDMIATAAGWCLPDLKGAILLLEDVDKGLGHIDRQLTMLRNAGYLKGLRGVAIGRFSKCGTASGWTVLEVLAGHLAQLNVPVLGGLPFGHDAQALAVPLGSQVTVDADKGRLLVAPAVA